MKTLTLFALLLTCGCTSLATLRYEYVDAHPDLIKYKREALLGDPARAVPGMTVEEVKLVLGNTLYRTARYSDGFEVWEKGANLVLYFERGQLSHWTDYSTR